VALSGGILSNLSGTSGYAEVAEDLNNAWGGTLLEDKERLDMSTSIDLFFEFPVGAHGIASSHLSLAKGDGVNDEVAFATYLTPFADDLESDLSDNDKLLEAWYEGTYMDGKTIVTVGILDGTLYIDNNEAANDETEQFMNAAFYNSGAIHGVPSYTPGMRITYQPDDSLYGTFLYIEGEDRDAAQERLFARSGGQSTLYAFEVGLHTGGDGTEGNWRLYTWYDSTDYTKLAGAGTENAKGFGISIDQQLSEDLIVYGRYASGDDDILRFKKYYNAGLALNLGENTLGFSAGLFKKSGDAKITWVTGANRADLFEKNLALLECYYRIHLTDTVSVTPDLQYVQNPLGSGDLDEVLIASMRLNVTF
jgi:high affinity Mn2+ porin